MADEIRHAAEGLWYRFRCPECDTMTDLEYDPRGVMVECEECGLEALVEGDY